MRLEMSLYASPMFLHCLKTNLTYWVCSETTLFNKDTFVPCELRSQEEDGPFSQLLAARLAEHDDDHCC